MAYSTLIREARGRSAVLPFDLRTTALRWITYTLECGHTLAVGRAMRHDRDGARRVFDFAWCPICRTRQMIEHVEK